jgi:maleylpyruvate isomerase
MSQAMAGARSTHDRLMRTLQDVDDDDARAPSLLPGWSRGHLLTHIARNADSHVRVLEGAIRGEVVEQYVGGYEGRAADIEAGARRPAAELVADVDTSARALFDLWDEVPRQVWDESRVALGDGKPAWISPFSRWRETEIHHVDLALGYEIGDWPLDFVAVVLPSASATIEGRLPPDTSVEVRADDLDFTARAGTSAIDPARTQAPARALLAWIAGRLPADSERRLGLPHLLPWL